MTPEHQRIVVTTLASLARDGDGTPPEVHAQRIAAMADALIAAVTKVEATGSDVRSTPSLRGFY